MTAHVTGTRGKWLAARLELLEPEKELTRRSDELARRRQELPWVRLDKEYRRLRIHVRNRRCHIPARKAGHERVRTRRWRRLSHLFRVCARTGRSLGYAPVARSGTQGARRDRRLVATPRRVRQALSGEMVFVALLRKHAFFGISALLFAVSVAVTIVLCTSMSAMGEMPMPGGWTMSMAWMRMPGQTWPGAASSFLGMWAVMMVAMMLPSLSPMLWRYRQAVAGLERRASAASLRSWAPVTSSSGSRWEWPFFRWASRWWRSRCSSRRW